MRLGTVEYTREEGDKLEELHSARIKAAEFIMPTGKRSLSSLSLDRGMSFVNRIPGFWKGGKKNESGYR